MITDPTVFVVDDDEGMRESLRQLLDASGLRVETFADAPSFLAAYCPDLPGCLLLDVRMPHMSGLVLQAELAARGIRLPIIMITAHGDVAKAVRALKAGAMDFIEKPFNPRALLGRVREALARDGENRSQQVRVEEIRNRLALLSPREQQIMRLTIAGLSNKQMALKLGLSRKTVELHRAHAMHKMEAQSLAELVRMALAVGPDRDALPTGLTDEEA